MKAASIALRIADFLKAYPPFEFFEEAELVALARSGRVKFHEVDEIIFTDGQPRDRYIYVVNQGRVRVEKPGKDKAELFDLRGPGDLLGMNGLLSDDPFVNNGVAETDVLLYALPRAEFSRLIESSDEAQRYLAAFFSLRTVHDRGKVPQQGPVTLRRGGLREVNEPHALAAETLQTIDEHSSGL
ncbi:MAG: cyclic nucleotide-binding domain-containing protein, partial [Opitutales bacterium]